MTVWEDLPTPFDVMGVRLMTSRDERLNLRVVIANCDHVREHYRR